MNTTTIKTIEGIIEFHRSDTNCKCCKGNHIFARGINFDDWESNLPSHLTRDTNLFVWEKILSQSDDLHGKKVRITVELIS